MDCVRILDPKLGLAAVRQNHDRAVQLLPALRSPGRFSQSAWGKVADF